MKKLAIAFAATAALTGQALAADMAVKARPAPPPVPVVNWTGCYIAGGGGYGLFDQENTGYFDGPPRVRITETADTGGRGWFGTVGGGCDYQFGMGGWNVVIGAFGDYDFADIKGTLNLPASPFFGREKMSEQWAVGGRIGVLITPQLLTYVSGGYTEANFDRVNFPFPVITGNLGSAVIPPTAPGIFIDSRWYKGWFIGSGYEYQLSFLPGLFWKTEYRFSELDRQSNPIRFQGTGVLTGFSNDSEKFVHTVRSELVWRFNWGGIGKSPVVARY